jgi:hypothetical protein
MAVVSSASKLLFGRLQGFSRVAYNFKYVSTSTGKYGNSSSKVTGRGKVFSIHGMKASWGVKV